jgi:hypothetical protein
VKNTKTVIKSSWFDYRFSVDCVEISLFTKSPRITKFRHKLNRKVKHKNGGNAVFFCENFTVKKNSCVVKYEAKNKDMIFEEIRG